jgi:signal transduction histidine kinase
VRESIERMDTSYVMGDDPERMDAGALIVAKPVRRAVPSPGAPAAGYLYLVLHTQQLPADRIDVLRSSFARPAMVGVIAVVAFTTLLALLIISAVTQPLRKLTEAVATLSQRGLAEGLTVAPTSPLRRRRRTSSAASPGRSRCCSTSAGGNGTPCAAPTHFRREGVSNLSHDLRSPLTATVACLETLDTRWAGAAEREDDRRLVEIALRNARNAAGMVRSLGDLAKLDEPEYDLRPEAVDVAELLDDIVVRFAERAARQGVALRAAAVAEAAAAPLRARIDVELFERAIANLVDNALKFCPRGSSVTLAAERRAAGIEVSVADDGPGIAPADLPQLFDRFYQSRSSVVPATADSGRGLGLAIVKRIVELHEGDVAVESRLGAGTRVTTRWPAAA